MTCGGRRGPALLLCAAAATHLLVTAAVYAAGRYALAPGTFDAHGVATSFADDGTRYREEATALSEGVRRGEFRSWAGAERDAHVKLYAVCFALFAPWLGYTVLGAEPLNALCYLACLASVFGLGLELFGRRAGLLAAGTAALWPSLLLHTTQFLKDPLYIALMLALVLVLVRWLTRSYAWPGALLSGAAGGLAATAIWLTRSDMGEMLVATVLLGAAALVARLVAERRAAAWNVVGMAIVVAATLGVPRLMSDALELGYQRPNAEAPVVRDALGRPTRGEDAGATRAGILSMAAAHVGKLRHGFGKRHPEAGSNVDADVQFDGAADLLRYLPRAAVVGFFAPFPDMWLARGASVGSAGRMLGGLETLLMYVVEALALIGLWRERRLPGWFLFALTAAGMTALGLVVVNVGTLFRLRYTFLLLLIVLAAGGVERLLGGRPGPAREAAKRGAAA